LAKPEEQRNDADDDETPVGDEVARRAALKLEREGKLPAEGDPDDDGEPAGSADDSDIDDEEVQQWLDEVVKTPEIQQVIRKAARDIASQSTEKSIKQVREELQADVDDRLESIEKRLKAGKISPDDADEEARAAAEAAAAAATGDDSRSAADEKRQQEQDEREAKLRHRELQNYRNEVLRGEDKTKLLPELVVISDGMSEDDIDKSVEDSKKTYTTIRKRLIKELRSMGWMSPTDLKTLAGDTPEEDPEDEDDDDQGGPPARDRQTRGLSRGRRQSLRERFKYGPRDKGGAAR